MSDEWYYEIADDVHGPVTGQELLQQANAGVIQPDTSVCKGSNGQWVQASQVKGLITASKLCPFCGEAILPFAKKCKHCGEFFESATPNNATQTEESNKRILPLFLLYFFFGWLGIHAFYAGRARGIFYLLALPLALIVGYGTPIIVGPDAPSLLLALTGALCIFIALAWSVCLFVDFIQIIIGSYKDGKGRRISKWT